MKKYNKHKGGVLLILGWIGLYFFWKYFFKTFPADGVVELAVDIFVCVATSVAYLWANLIILFTFVQIGEDRVVFKQPTYDLNFDISFLVKPPTTILFKDISSIETSIAKSLVVFNMKNGKRWSYQLVHYVGEKEIIEYFANLNLNNYK